MPESPPARFRDVLLSSLALLTMLGLAAWQRCLIDVLAVLLIFVAFRLRYPAGLPLAGMAGGLLLCLISLSLVADAALRYYFARPLQLQYDVFLLPALWDLLRDSSGIAVAAASTAGLLTAVAAAAWGFSRLLHSATACFVTPLSLAVLGLSVLLQLTVAVSSSQTSALVAGLRDAAFESDEDKLFQRELNVARSEAAALPDDLNRLAGADFVLFFIESYGRLLWDDPDLRQDFQPVLSSIDADLDAAGYTVASRFLRSPTFGGASWLAHMSVMSGVDTSNQTRWESLLASDIRPLPDYFRSRGYETVSVMPAMYIDSWPEGDYFSFSRHVWARELGYQGPKYAWSPMPDQYVLLRMQELILDAGDKPIFAEVALTSSHSPFSVRPAFHTGAWNGNALATTLATVDPDSIPWSWDEMSADDYLLAVRYSLRSVGQFLARHYERPATLVILGDHQATKAIHGVDSEAMGTIRDVPMHVVTRDRDIHERLLERGFAAGMNPRQSGSALPMEDLKALFLNLFHRDDAAGD